MIPPRRDDGRKEFVMKEVATVYRTNDLSMFKTLKANREVGEARKQMLIKSIDQNGYLTNPIIVNERFEVIDGQGRLAACKELGSPIDYMIVPHAGIKECMVLNMNTKNWRVTDFIQSYAEQGNENYIRLLELSKLGLGYNVFMFANGLYGGSNRGPNDATIKKGVARSSEETYKNAKVALEYLKTVKPFIDRIEGRRVDMECAVLFAYKDENCDNSRLSEALSKYYHLIQGVVGLKMAMDELAKIYNRNLKGKPRLYLSEDYDRQLRG